MIKGLNKKKTKSYPIWSYAGNVYTCPQSHATGHLTHSRVNDIITVHVHVLALQASVNIHVHTPLIFKCSNSLPSLIFITHWYSNIQTLWYSNSLSPLLSRTPALSLPLSLKSDSYIVNSLSIVVINFIYSFFVPPLLAFAIWSLFECVY